MLIYMADIEHNVSVVTEKTRNSQEVVHRLTTMMSTMISTIFTDDVSFQG